tara:strand:+ start:37 stop:1050 length:1014 start_codon:yes stop_codon:yes gene_type:complete
MTLPASGQITLNQVNVELGLSGTAQIGIGDANVRTLFDVATGQITMSDGYGKADNFTLTISSNTTKFAVNATATAAGWDGSTDLIVKINSGVSVYSDSANSSGSYCILADVACTIDNSGNIMGKGGNSSGSQTGGNAIRVTSSGVTILNNSGAYIAAGGAGGYGGGGAGGGIGTGQTAVDPAPGTFTVGTTYTYSGDSAGAGGGSAGVFGASYAQGVGGNGGRILPGVGGQGGANPYPAGNTTQPYQSGVGGNGGSAGNPGGNNGKNYGVQGQFQYSMSGSGGGWGAAAGLEWGIDNASPPNSGNPGGGSAGGKAIFYNGGTPSITNNGTIYGATST